MTEQGQSAEDVRTLLRLYDELVAEVVRLDPYCQRSGWDTNEETKAAVDRVRATPVRRDNGAMTEQGQFAETNEVDYSDLGFPSEPPDGWPENPYDEDGYCEFCGSGSWKLHAPWCQWQDAKDAEGAGSSPEAHEPMEKT